MLCRHDKDLSIYKTNIRNLSRKWSALLQPWQFPPQNQSNGFLTQILFNTNWRMILCPILLDIKLFVIYFFVFILRFFIFLKFIAYERTLLIFTLDKSTVEITIGNRFQTFLRHWKSFIKQSFVNGVWKILNSGMTEESGVGRLNYRKSIQFSIGFTEFWTSAETVKTKQTLNWILLKIKMQSFTFSLKKKVKHLWSVSEPSCLSGKGKLIDN